MRALFVQSWVVIVLAGVLAGCDDGGGGRPGGRRDAGGGGGGGETGAQCSDGIDNDDDGVLDCDESSCWGTTECARDSGPRPDTGFGECETVDFAAETALAPVDIVWIIDNSGSMGEESGFVRDQLNGFASSIAASGLDFRVILVTSPDEFAVRIAPPLGPGMRADPLLYDLPPEPWTDRLLTVNYNVQSNDGFSATLGAWDHFAPFLRPAAITHIIVVTDDEPSSSPGAAEFQSSVRARLGHSFVFHAIASPPGSTHMECVPFFGCIPAGAGCSGPNGDAEANGDVYWSVAMATGGSTLSICAPDWTAIFGTLTASIAVPMPIPCEFLIPEAPEGMTFDRSRVNVLYTPGSGGAAETFPYVGQPDGSVLCPASGNGWYYDDASAPTQIILCPSTCDLVEADAAGTVNIALGCETIFG